MTSPDWKELLQQGTQAAQARQGQAALKALQQASQLQPGSRDVRYWLGQAQRLCSQVREAEQSFRSLLEANPLDFETALALAFLLREQGRIDELGKVVLCYAQQASASATALLQIAGLLRDCNQFHGAIEVMKIVLSREIEQPGGDALQQQKALAVNQFRLARLYQGTGQHAEALQAYRAALQLDPTLGGAWLGLAALQRFTDPTQPDWQMLTAATLPSANAETTMCLAFARAKGLDDLQQYSQAWDQYVEGNRLRDLSQPWDRAGWQQQLRQISSAPLEALVEPVPSRRPVFIVGMLRSGTTLLEQLLDQHPQVTARGELNFLSHAWKLWQQNPVSTSLAEDLARQIWIHMRQEGPEDHFYIDKNPLNFRFVPLLAAIMPEARILHLQRDGRDTCLSCFMQVFQHPDSAFANRLDDLEQYYQDYLLLMQRYQQLMPGRILNLAYEDLVENSQGTIGRVLEFLGLQGQDNGCAQEGQQGGGGTPAQRPIRTASSWQARQGVHRRSLARWQNYHEFSPAFFGRIAELDQLSRGAQNANNGQPSP